MTWYKNDYSAPAGADFFTEIKKVKDNVNIFKYRIKYMNITIDIKMKVMYNMNIRIKRCYHEEI